MFDWLLEFLSSSPWTYPIVGVIVAVDAFFPVVPGETAVITAAILSSDGALSIVLVALAGWVGATAGDNVSYFLGRELGGRASRRLFRGKKARARLDWACRQIAERGRTMIAAGRFVPGGRTATTFAAGMLEMPWRHFMSADLPATFAWATIVAAIGYLGGQAFADSFWKPLVLSLAVGALIVVGAELWRRWRHRGDESDSAGARKPASGAT